MDRAGHQLQQHFRLPERRRHRPARLLLPDGPERQHHLSPAAAAHLFRPQAGEHVAHRGPARRQQQERQHDLYAHLAGKQPLARCRRELRRGAHHRERAGGQPHSGRLRHRYPAGRRYHQLCAVPHAFPPHARPDGSHASVRAGCGQFHLCSGRRCARGARAVRFVRADGRADPAPHGAGACRGGQPAQDGAARPAGPDQPAFSL